jgi:hypothetical protein
MVLGCYRRDEANNPEIYSAAIAAIFEDYSRVVVERAADPRTGIASQYKFLPAVAEVREFCDREAERERRWAKPARRYLPVSENFCRPPGADFADMAEKHVRPIGRFEEAGDKWNRF